MIKPRFLDAVFLPTSVKNKYLEKYRALLDQLSQVQVPIDYNASDPHNCSMIVKEHAQMYANILETVTPSDAGQMNQQLVEHCRKWDQIYGYNARELYPELQDIWNRYGY